MTPAVLEAVTAAWDASSDLRTLVPGRLHLDRAPQQMADYDGRAVPLKSPYAVATVEEQPPLVDSEGGTRYAAVVSIGVYTAGGPSGTTDLYEAVPAALSHDALAARLHPVGLVGVWPAQGSFKHDAARVQARDVVAAALAFQVVTRFKGAA